jgi:hypothetical protein
MTARAPAAPPRRPMAPVWHLMPSGWSVPFIILGTIWVATFGSCTGVQTVAEIYSGKEATTSALTALGLTGFFLMPVGALLLFVGAVFAGRWAARAAMMALTLVTLGIGCVFLILGSTADRDIVGSTIVISVLYGIPMIVVFVVLLVSIINGVKEVRLSIEEGRRLRMEDLLSCRGEVSFATVAEEVRLPLAGIPDYVNGLVGKRQLLAVVDGESQMVYSRERFDRKERDLVSIVYGRERVGLEDLTQELRMSERRLVELLGASMQRGVFAGWVDWKARQVGSAEVGVLRDGGVCPGCGGGLDLAGRGVRTCPYCRAEVFLV